MTRRMYTAAERAVIHQHYHSATGKELAAMLGRTRASVHRTASKLGLRKRPPRITPAMRERVRELHAEGLTDADIARRLGMSRSTVRICRRDKLGLPTNDAAIRAAIREASQRAIKTQRATLGITSAGQLRAFGHRRFAASRGWPEILKPRHVQILELLAIAGRPMRRKDIATRIGHTLKNQKSNMLADLANLGFVVRLKRQHRVTGKGRGYSCDLYTLSPAALDIIINRRGS